MWTVLLPDQLFPRVEGPVIIFMHPFYFRNACYNRVLYLLTATKAYCTLHEAKMVWEMGKLPERFKSFVNPNKEIQRWLASRSDPQPTPYFLFPENRSGKFGHHTSMLTIYKALRRKYYPHLQDSRGNPKPFKGKVAWSYDVDNRKSGKALMRDQVAQRELARARKFDSALRNKLLASPHRAWAVKQINIRFKNLYGGNEGAYPHDRRTALACLKDFVTRRLKFFGYEDAINRNFSGTLADDEMLHSRLSMALNVGLLVPIDYVMATRGLAMSSQLEGFIRQFLGWREYANHCYHTMNIPLTPNTTTSKTGNYMGNHVKLPKSWYKPGATTGIALVDVSLAAVWRTGYAHHIIRLMVLGNFCLLSQYDPLDVYRWFLTMFVDAHEWVMVMNVLCMSQYAVKGATRRPYFSSSRYLDRMSGGPSSPSQDKEGAIKWDTLYRSFLRQKRQKLKQEYVVSNFR
jgi:deoxyribodipyrimidine photolyase-like uncharacterized protein